MRNERSDQLISYGEPQLNADGVPGAQTKSNLSKIVPATIENVIQPTSGNFTQPKSTTLQNGNSAKISNPSVRPNATPSSIGSLGKEIQQMNDGAIISSELGVQALNHTQAS